MKRSSSRRSTVRITVLLVIAIAGFVFTSTGVVLLLSGQAAYHNTWELLRSTGLMAIESVEDEIRDHVKLPRKLPNISAGRSPREKSIQAIQMSFWPP